MISLINLIFSWYSWFGIWRLILPSLALPLWHCVSWYLYSFCYCFHDAFVTSDVAIMWLTLTHMCNGWSTFDLIYWSFFFVVLLIWYLETNPSLFGVVFLDIVSALELVLLLFFSWCSWFDIIDPLDLLNCFVFLWYILFSFW